MIGFFHLSTEKKKEGKEECTFFHHVIYVHMYRPWFICGQSLSHHNDGKEKRKREPYCIIFSKHIYVDVRSITIYHSFFFTLLPLQPGTPGIPRGPTAPGCPGNPF
jgi:hypothetical protein